MWTLNIPGGAQSAAHHSYQLHLTIQKSSDALRNKNSYNMLKKLFLRFKNILYSNDRLFVRSNMEINGKYGNKGAL